MAETGSLGMRMYSCDVSVFPFHANWSEGCEGLWRGKSIDVLIDM